MALQPNVLGDVRSGPPPGEPACLGHDVMMALVQNQLGADEFAKADAHLDGCSECRIGVALLFESSAADSVAFGTVSTAAPPSSHDLAEASIPPARPTSPSLALLPGAPLGRYLVDGLLGEGGMGVVYSAFDPELNRKVALKMMRTSLAEHPEARERFLREARAMARLAHPNVVAVYDVGEHENQLFLAMEFVEGITLGAWLQNESRPFREVLGALIQAGRGLGAAHAAGLVHRDFKPENVLCDQRGRVRVTDFGVARAARSPAAPGLAAGGHATTPGAQGQGVLNAHITAAGVVVGTPAYMAPEQFRGETADARTDQFAFCVVLYEALYGEPPFDGDTPEERAAHVLRGAIRRPPAGSTVPTWLRHHLLRGLSTAPEARFPSMHALLKALKQDPRRARRRAVATAGLVLFVGASASATFALSRHQQPVCTGAERKLSGVWDAERKHRVEQGLLGSGKPYAQDTWRGVERAIDTYASAWVSMHVDACEATRLRGEQSDQVLGLRMACLERRLDEVKSLTTLLAQGKAPVVEKALQAAGELGKLDDCARTDALTSLAPLPHDITLQTQIADVRKRLDDARVRISAGQYAEARALAEAAAPQAQLLHYRPLEAEVLFALGEAQHKTGDVEAAEATLTQAAAQATAGRHYEVAGRAWAQLAFVVGVHRRQHGRAHGMMAQAQAILEGYGGDEAQLRSYLGAIFSSEGKYSEALAQHDYAVALRERQDQSRPWLIAQSLNNRGNVLQRQARYEEATQSLKRALELTEQSLGATHPLTAVILSNMGNLLAVQGLYAEALTYHERALALHVQALGPEHPYVATSHNNLGNVQQKMGRLPRALEHYQQALNLWRKALGPEHPNIVDALNNVGSVLTLQRDYKTSLALHKKALAIGEKALGPAHPQVAETLTGLGDLWLARKQHRRALASYKRALAINEKSLGSNHPDLAPVLVGMGESQIGLGAPQQATPLLELAVRLSESVPSKRLVLAGSRFALARALAARKVTPEAIELARQARAAYLAAGSTSADELAKVNAWLIKAGAAR